MNPREPRTPASRALLAVFALAALGAAVASQLELSAGLDRVGSVRSVALVSVVAIGLQP